MKSEKNNLELNNKILEQVIRKIGVDQLRNLTGYLNRQTCGEGMRRVLSDIFSPPFKGYNPSSKERPYPKQLSGLHSDEKQKLNITGNTSTGQGFGGAVGSYGVATGSSYAT